MVKVRMGQYHRVDFTGRHGGVLPITLAPFFLTLKQSAVDEHLHPFFAVAVKRSIDEMFRSGDRTGRTKKLDIGQEASVIC
jgi:hypothetical protein